MRNIVFVILIVIIGCSGNQNKTAERSYFNLNTSEESEFDYSGEKPIQNISDKSEESENIEIESKLIKEANISIEVKEIEWAFEEIKKIVKNNKGYFTKEEDYLYDYSRSIHALIRVPAQNFDVLIGQIIEIAKKVESKTIEVKDVTEEFVDMQARLNTKKNIEKRYLEILKKANTINDILKVEEYLGKIREEIESIEGRLKYLQNKVNYCTIDLHINQRIEKKVKFEFISKFWRALKGGWLGFLNFIIVVFYIWPILLILIIILYTYKKIRKRKK